MVPIVLSVADKAIAKVIFALLNCSWRQPDSAQTSDTSCGCFTEAIQLLGALKLLEIGNRRGRRKRGEGSSDRWRKGQRGLR